MGWVRNRLHPRTRYGASLPFRLPRLATEADIGLGDLVEQTLSLARIRPCQSCARRAESLNRLVMFSRPLRQRPLRRSRGASSASTAGCWEYRGKCTGWRWWVTECVEGPASQDPDAEIIQQCCGGLLGRYSYPWIEVCPGQPATKGCGWCLW
jgi:hypothetical protein